VRRWLCSSQSGRGDAALCCSEVIESDAHGVVGRTGRRGCVVADSAPDGSGGQGHDLGGFLEADVYRQLLPLPTELLPAGRGAAEAANLSNDNPAKKIKT
jgi:hypothetical protein